MAKVLIVDDDARCSAMMRQDLLRQGHRPLLVDSARAALTILDAGVQVDVVLTDLVMPDMDGIELIQALRRSHSAIRIIAILSCDDQNRPNILSMARVLGADRVLYKPVIAAVMEAAIRRLLQADPVDGIVIDGTIGCAPHRCAA